TSNNQYEILMAAALLRKLLTDENPLVDQVNRNRKLKIAFTINGKKSLDETGLEFWTVQDGFDPETSNARIILQTVKKDELLKRTSMIVKGKAISVLALIRFLCHIEGAVHIDNPTTEEEVMLKTISEHMTVFGGSPVIRSISAISRVVLKGLEPLKQEVLKDQN